MARRRATPAEKAEARRFLAERQVRWMRERAASQAVYAEQERVRKAEEKRKLAVHMGRSTKTRIAESQLLGEKVGASSVKEFWPHDEQRDCIRRTCLAAQRDALREAKSRMAQSSNLWSEYGTPGPMDAMERRAFLRGAWWSIQRKLASICRPEVADGEQEGMFGFGCGRGRS